MITPFNLIQSLFVKLDLLSAKKYPVKILAVKFPSTDGYHAV